MLTVKTDAIEVRELKPSDFDHWLEAYRGLLPARSLFDRLPALGGTLSREGFLKTLSRHAAEAARSERFEFGVFRRHDSALVGATDFSRFSRVPIRTALLGYSIFNRYWGQGLGSQAVQSALEIGFNKLGLDEIFVEIEPGNDRSLAIAKKFRFQPSSASGPHLRFSLTRPRA